MLINLRKAHQLRSLAEARQVTLANPKVIDIPILAEDVAKRATEATDKLTEESAQADELETVVRNIRTAIDKANYESGINALLAEQGSLTRKLTRLTRLTEMPVTSLEDLKAAIEFEKQPASRDSRYHTRTPSVSWYAVTKEQVEQAKEEEVKVRRQLRTLSDDLMGRNFNTQIKVSDADITVLEKLKVV